jgi:hypothetical protein
LPFGLKRTGDGQEGVGVFISVSIVDVFGYELLKNGLKIFKSTIVERIDGLGALFKNQYPCSCWHESVGEVVYIQQIST